MDSEEQFAQVFVCLQRNPVCPRFLALWEPNLSPLLERPLASTTHSRSPAFPFQSRHPESNLWGQHGEQKQAMLNPRCVLPRVTVG